MNFSNEALDLLATTASANRRSTVDDGVGGESRHHEDLLKEDDFMKSVVTPSPCAKSDRSDEVLKNSNVELFQKLDYREKVHFNTVPVRGYNIMTCLQDTEEFVDCMTL
jgi:hypothetical protein